MQFFDISSADDNISSTSLQKSDGQLGIEIRYSIQLVITNVNSNRFVLVVKHKLIKRMDIQTQVDKHAYGRLEYLASIHNSILIR